MNELRLHKAHTRLLEQTALPLGLRPQAVPRGPAASEPLIHQASHAHLAQMGDTLLLLALKLLLHLSPDFRLLANTGSHGLAGSLEFPGCQTCLLLRRIGSRNLCGQALPNRHGLVTCHFERPSTLPVRVGSHQLGFYEASTRLLEEVALSPRFGPEAMQCRPAHRKLLVHEALEAHLANVFDALLLLALEFFLHATLELVLQAFARRQRISCVLEVLLQLLHLS